MVAIRVGARQMRMLDVYTCPNATQCPSQAQDAPMKRTLQRLGYVPSDCVVLALTINYEIRLVGNGCALDRLHLQVIPLKIHESDFLLDS